MPPTPNYSRAAFYIGLFGIVLTGLLVGIGVDNYWEPSRFFFTLRWQISSWVAFAILYAGACDLFALGVVFSAAVIFVQRLRRRI